MSASSAFLTNMTHTLGWNILGDLVTWWQRVFANLLSFSTPVNYCNLYSSILRPWCSRGLEVWEWEEREPRCLAQGLRTTAARWARCSWQLSEAAAPPSCWDPLGSPLPRRQGVRPPSPAFLFSHQARGHAQQRSPRPPRSPAWLPWALGSSAAAGSGRRGGGGRARAATGSSLPSPHPTRSPCPSSLHCAALGSPESCQHLPRGVRSCPTAEPTAHRALGPPRASDAGVGAPAPPPSLVFPVGWTPATRWDPLLSPPPLTAPFPALGSWRSGELERARRARSLRATGGRGVRGRPRGSTGGVSARGWREGRRDLSVSRPGCREAPGARRMGARVWPQPAAPGRAPACAPEATRPAANFFFRSPSYFGNWRDCDVNQ